jgi:MFS transporter, FSR family, fosmidomycin resistance protein
MSVVHKPAADAPASSGQGGSPAAEATVFAVLFAISFAHLLNDTIQSLLPALFPVIKETFALSYGQIGIITLAFQTTACLLQPLVGLVADRRPMPWSLVIGMCFTCIGVMLLAFAPTYAALVLAAVFIGLGSSVFHPESARVARMAAGPRRGLAQSVFQVGGNAGSSMGPLLAAFVVVAIGQSGIAWFTVIPLAGMVVLWRVGLWYRRRIDDRAAGPRRTADDTALPFSRNKVLWTIAMLLLLIFSKQFYMTGLMNYYTFYLIETFGVPVPTAQIYLFFYLFAVAVGTLLGGWLSDHLGRKTIIWLSILGALPFTLILPEAGLMWTAILTLVIGLVMASSMAVIVVFAQDLIPGRVGMVSGLFLGFAFGMSGLGAALLGQLADATSLEFVFRVCSFLPALGFVAAFLPNVERRTVTRKA